jgi:hypothetical protein
MDSIIPGCDYFIETLVASTTDAETAPTPSAGRADVTVVFSATDGGAAISPALTVTCTDKGATKTVAGQSYQIYTGTLAGSDTAAALATYVGISIYRRTMIGTHATSSVPVAVKTR